MPAAIIPASICWLILHEHEQTKLALYSLPCAMIMNVIFLFFWRTIPRIFSRIFYKRIHKIPFVLVIGFTTILSVLIWTACGVGLLYFLDQFEEHLIYISISSSCIVLLCGLIMSFVEKLPPPNNRLNISHSMIQFVTGLLSFIFISSSILLSRVHITAAGVLASFPDFFLLRYCFIKKQRKITLSTYDDNFFFVAKFFFHWFSAISNWWYEMGITENRPVNLNSTLYITNMILGSLSISAYCLLFGAFYDFEFSYWSDNEIAALVICTTTSLALSFFFFTVPSIVLLRMVQLFVEKKIDPIIMQSPFSHLKARLSSSNLWDERQRLVTPPPTPFQAKQQVRGSRENLGGQNTVPAIAISTPYSSAKNLGSMITTPQGNKTYGSNKNMEYDSTTDESDY